MTEQKAVMTEDDGGARRDGISVGAFPDKIRTLCYYDGAGLYCDARHANRCRACSLADELAAALRRQTKEDFHAGITQEVGAEARTGGGWREIGSAPKDGTTWFLGFGIPDWATDEPPRIMTCCWSVEANNWCDTGDFVELTHWMPLPSAPTERP